MSLVSKSCPARVTEGDIFDDARENLKAAIEVLLEANRVGEKEMRRGLTGLKNGRKHRVKPSDRSQLLLDRIRRRRERIQDRVGVLEGTARIIREERESRS
jgi:hypothetical protein